MSKHEAIAVSVYLGGMFVAIAIAVTMQAWSDVRVAQAEADIARAEATECVCEGAP